MTPQKKQKKKKKTRKSQEVCQTLKMYIFKTKEWYLLYLFMQNQPSIVFNELKNKIQTLIQQQDISASECVSIYLVTFTNINRTPATGKTVH